MARLYRTLTALAVTGLVAGAAGFVVFADRVRHEAPQADARADAVVVLTGDDDRITSGFRLIAAGRAQRLLISGVNTATRVPAELKRQSRAGDAESDGLLRCCVDLGRDALNTGGNADEAQLWAQARGYRSLIVVTSSYHMPRSLMEFQRAMPHVELVPYPVASRHLQLERWWLHVPTIRLLAAEYVKFLGAAARLGCYRVMVPAPPPAARPLPSSVSARAVP